MPHRSDSPLAGRLGRPDEVAAGHRQRLGRAARAVGRAAAPCSAKAPVASRHVPSSPAASGL